MRSFLEPTLNEVLGTELLGIRSTSPAREFCVWRTGLWFFDALSTAPFSFKLPIAFIDGQINNGFVLELARHLL